MLTTTHDTQMHWVSQDLNSDVHTEIIIKLMIYCDTILSLNHTVLRIRGRDRG